VAEGRFAAGVLIWLDVPFIGLNDRLGETRAYRIEAPQGRLADESHELPDRCIGT